MLRLLEHRRDPVAVGPVARRRRTDVAPRQVVERHELRPVGAHRLLQARPPHVRGVLWT